MLPSSDDPCTNGNNNDSNHFKPKSPDNKHKYNLTTSLKPYYPFHHHRRAWLLLVVVAFQLILLLSIIAPTPPRRSAPIQTNAPTHSIRTGHEAAKSINPYEEEAGGRKSRNFHDGECPQGRVYVYELPPLLNADIVRSCHGINPWHSRCDALSNSGFGKPAFNRISRIIPQNLARSWFWTDQFSLELIFHKRILNYRCRTLDPEKARAFYIPFYTGLAVERALFTKGSTPQERDFHCDTMLDWVSEQPLFQKSKGWDHFITIGRISWDFRRTRDQDWGSSCIYKPKMRNITRLLIEKNPWDYFDIGVPYPTGFHPKTLADVTSWQDFVRTRQRKTLFCFAGATRGFIANDFRTLLLNQCYKSSGACRVVDCSGTKCVNGSLPILETFLDSDFCLQPRGDSFTRRSIFDCMIAGSIPVFFWHRTAYMQYDWFLPGEPGSYSVFIHRDEVKNGTHIKSVLEKIGREKIREMREKVIEYIPKMVYANSEVGLESVNDAFDAAVEGVLMRVNEQNRLYKWK